tara:strand:- start:15843 stop:16088 length:246 start_codon:yes stop_codon:yes gene_type:complete
LKCLSGERLGEIQPTFSIPVNVGTREGATREGLTGGRRGGVSLKTRGAGGRRTTSRQNAKKLTHHKTKSTPTPKKNISFFL